MLDVSEAEFDRVFAVNVKSIYLFARAGVPQMETRGGGVIVNIGSTAGLRPRPGLAWYNGTKGAVHAITKSMAFELAPNSIRVCAMTPVAGETPLLVEFMGADTPEQRASSSPRSRWGACPGPPTSPTPPCSSPPPRAATMTGVVLEVDGGRCV